MTASPATPSGDGLLSADQVAGRLGVTESWLRRQANNRFIPCTRLGRQLRFTEAQVASIIHAAEQAPLPQPAFGLTRRSRRAG